MGPGALGVVNDMLGLVAPFGHFRALARPVFGPFALCFLVNCRRSSAGIFFYIMWPSVSVLSALCVLCVCPVLESGSLQLLVMAASYILKMFSIMCA